MCVCLGVLVLWANVLVVALDLLVRGGGMSICLFVCLREREKGAIVSFLLLSLFQFPLFITLI